MRAAPREPHAVCCIRQLPLTPRPSRWRRSWVAPPGSKKKGKAAAADEQKGWEPKPTPSDQVAAAILDAVAFIREGLLEKAQARPARGRVPR